MAASALSGLPGLLRRMARSGVDDSQRDEVLLGRFTAARDEEAFAELVRRHGPMVLAVCRRLLRDEHLAEDAFQASFLVLARKAGTIKRGGALGGWLHRVARHAALRARAQFGQQSTATERWANMATPVHGQAEPDLRAVLDEEIARLPESYRAAVVLCYLQ